MHTCWGCNGRSELASAGGHFAELPPAPACEYGYDDRSRAAGHFACDASLPFAPSTERYVYDANRTPSDPAHNITSTSGRIGCEDFPPAAASTTGRSGNDPDGEPKLYYYGLRFYRPQIGRWVSRDPLSEVDRGNYIFALNSPLTHGDRFGLVSYDLTIKKPVGRPEDIPDSTGWPWGRTTPKVELLCRCKLDQEKQSCPMSCSFSGSIAVDILSDQQLQIKNDFYRDEFPWKMQAYSSILAHETAHVAAFLRAVEEFGSYVTPFETAYATLDECATIGMNLATDFSEKFQAQINWQYGHPDGWDSLRPTGPLKDVLDRWEKDVDPDGGTR